tara:strand:+ start:381 stop:1448 length:1068 start_codon:yes stop_codon:yes gene_type:complete
MTVSVGHTDDISSGFGTFGLPNSYFGGISGNLEAQIVAFSTYTNDSKDIYQGRYDAILEPLEAIDDKIVTDYLVPINTKKQQIQTLGQSSVWVANPQTYSSSTAALSAIETIYQESNTDNDNQACTVIGFTTFPGFGGTAGTVVTQGTTDLEGEVTITARGTVSFTGSPMVLQDVEGTFSSLYPLTVGVTSIGAPTAISYTGLTNIREDVVMVTHFTKMEPPDNSVDNPYANDQYPLLDANTNGVGAAQTFFPNAIDTIAGGNPTISAAQNYGKVYTSSSATNNSQIDTLDSEIVTLRAGITTYNDGANVLKELKTSYALAIWSYERGNKLNDEELAKYQNAINILRDPSIGGPY